MGLLDAAGSFLSSFKLNDVVGSLFGDTFNNLLGDQVGGFASDLLSGAVTNAAVAGISGGDIGKAALYGAAGGALGGSFGQLGSTLGGALQGYGLSESVGGEGWQGALAGGVGGYLAGEDPNADFMGRKKATTAKPDPRNVAQNGASQPAEVIEASEAVTAGDSISNKLKDFGLINENGEGTLLGNALVAGISGAAEQKNAEELLEKQLDNRKDLEEYQAKLDHEAEQKRIAAFTNPRMQFEVRRNG